MHKRLLTGLLASSKYAFFLECANCLRRKYHRYFLAIYYKSFLLEVWFEGALGAAQAKAHIVAKLFTFTGKFTACCHNRSTPLLLNNLY